MSVILGAILPTIIDKLGNALTKKLQQPGTAVAPKPVVAAAVPAVVAAVTEAVQSSEDIAVVAVKPMSTSVEGWTAIGGALVSLVTMYGGSILPGPVIDAFTTISNTVGGWFGLPPGFLSSAIVIVAFGVIWVRRKWFTKSITPAAADRGSAQGTVI